MKTRLSFLTKEKLVQSICFRRKLEYKCKGDSTCQVDVNRRNQCQACRFQRCLAVQMKPSGETYFHLFSTVDKAFYLLT